MLFKRAEPVWARNRQDEMNCELAFRAVCGSADKARVIVATSCVYQLRVNGRFVAAGPARAVPGIFYADDIDLTRFLTEDRNVVVIDVVGYNVNSYDTLKQPSFVTAEILLGDQVVAHTGDDSLCPYDLKQRVRRVERYSLQRAFAEAYRLKAGLKGFYEDPEFEMASESWERQPEVRCLPREVPMPRFDEAQAAFIGQGSARLDAAAVDARRSCCPMYSEQFLGYPEEEQEFHLLQEGKSFRCLSATAGDGPYWALYSFSRNLTGFPSIHVRSKGPARVYLLFDELLTEGTVDFLRLSACNCFRYDLDAGEHEIRTIAPYTMQFVNLVVDGACTIESVAMTKYEHPPVPFRVSLPDDDVVLRHIAEAAENTFLQNAVDIFTDCPSRERAGWLCDSFFTARVEYVLTGQCGMERVFLRNFLLPESFKGVPKGMLPMCWPADFYDGCFIPNWAMWFVLELEEYASRSGDIALVEEAYPRVRALLEYLRAFENEFGLLEGLKGWVFVEWSRANDPDVVRGVNFPTNMLYARMLRAVAKLYGRPELAEQAERLKRMIRERSRIGLFFADNEVRTGNRFVNPGNCTEACQYYAFFTGVATRAEDGELWDCLIRDFGVGRDHVEVWPDVSPANAFIGNYLILFSIKIATFNPLPTGDAFN